MKAALVLPEKLSGQPQLAILSALEHLLQQAYYALVAAHPELASGNGASDFDPDVSELWLADALCNQLSTVQYTLERYRELVSG